MIFAHSSDKSKCNLGELSDLPDSSKTPFENIAEVQANKTWKFVDSATGSNAMSYRISDYPSITEVMLVCKYIEGSGERIVTVNIPEVTLPLGGIVNLHVGNPTFYGNCRINSNGITKRINITEFFYSNADVTSYMSTMLYVKE